MLHIYCCLCIVCVAFVFIVLATPTRTRVHIPRRHDTVRVRRLRSIDVIKHHRATVLRKDVPLPVDEYLSRQVGGPKIDRVGRRDVDFLVTESVNYAPADLNLYIISRPPPRISV